MVEEFKGDDFRVHLEVIEEHAGDLFDCLTELLPASFIVDPPQRALAQALVNKIDQATRDRMLSWKQLITRIVGALRVKDELSLRCFVCQQEAGRSASHYSK